MGKFCKITWVIRAILYRPFSKIGFPCYIGKPKFIRKLKGLEIGNKVRIYPGIRVELESENAKLRIGNNVSIGQDCHFVSYSDILEIGNNVVISGNVMISNCDHNYEKKDLFLYDQGVKINNTIIGDYCFIGYGAVILAGTKLGRQCIIGANSVVRGEYPDYCVIAGSPARIVRKLNLKTGEWERV